MRIARVSSIGRAFEDVIGTPSLSRASHHGPARAEPDWLGCATSGLAGGIQERLCVMRCRRRSLLLAAVALGLLAAPAPAFAVDFGANLNDPASLIPWRHSWDQNAFNVS